MPIQTIYELTHWSATIIDATSPTIPDVLPKGVITDLTLPTLERDVDTTKRAGELGVVARPKFFNEMEVTFSVKSVFKELIQALVKGFQTSYTLKAVACLSSDAGTVIPYTVEAKGFTTSLPFGDLSADGLESEFTMMPFYLKVTIDTNITIYDPRNYILSINGTNIFDNVKNIIDPT